MEVLMNVHAAKSAARAVAPYLGCCDAPAGATRAGVSPGLWLVWRYEVGREGRGLWPRLGLGGPQQAAAGVRFLHGCFPVEDACAAAAAKRTPSPRKNATPAGQGSNTLASYLGRRDGPRALALDLGVPEALVVPVALRHVLSNLAVLHAAGLIHRCACSQLSSWVAALQHTALRAAALLFCAPSSRAVRLRCVAPCLALHGRCTVCRAKAPPFFPPASLETPGT